ncbi:hypothetical protein HR45_06365 [Shewanella mangrovi]|uniref:Nitrate reductase n=2 Tax=Shewanella mangrovi TaxID=1515746 RepID=A0A094JJ98_9GAMM|nr:hypothetical protein HR45_06365 [Shewanella mangrovi]
MLISWLRQSESRMRALAVAARLNLPQGYIAAGFIRNLVWDRFHGITTALNDIDLIYFDPNDVSDGIEAHYQQQLKQWLPIAWSVKNQARMHLKHKHQPYTGVLQAMRYWPEHETAIAARLKQGQVEIIHTGYLRSLLALQLTRNPHAVDGAFQQRVADRGWLEIYQHLKLIL